jgi:hypothetical protein
VSLCALAAGWVQMRCGECAAEVAVTARVCSGCGAPIVGQPPVADTVVADTVVGAVSDAAGKAVAAGVAVQSLPEPYVPGSGDKLPAELRLVLDTSVLLVAGSLSPWPAPRLSPFTFALTDLITGCCSAWPSGRFLGALWLGLWLGLWRAFKVSDFPGCSGGPAIHTRPR